MNSPKRKLGDYFDRTKYSQGILPIDTYKKDVDDIVKPNYNMDWEKLRAEIMTNGLRHSTLTAQMPSESSSVSSNATNGIEPPRDYLSVKKSKKINTETNHYQYSHLKSAYTCYDMYKTTQVISVFVAVMQVRLKVSVVTGHTIPKTMIIMKCLYQLWRKTY